MYTQMCLHAYSAAMDTMDRSTKSPAHLLQRWVSPGFFDFWSTRLNSLWTLAQPLARVEARETASRDAVTLVLRPNRHWHGLLPGQHVTLGVEIDGRRLKRSYTPTPLARGRLAITVKAITGGTVSRHLVERAQVGDVVTLDAAFGELTLPAPERPLLLLAAGSGITPMRALLRQAAERGLSAPVDLVYWVRERAQACFIEEFEALAAAHPLLRLRLLVTGEGGKPAPRIDALPLDGLDVPAGRDVLACGPAGFVATAQARLAGLVARFQGEAFSSPAIPADDEGEVEVQLTRSGKRLRVPRARSLLEGLEAAGLRPKHGCRMGICNTCVCTRQSGATRHLHDGRREAEPDAAVRLCVSAPSTDLSLDL